MIVTKASSNDGSWVKVESLMNYIKAIDATVKGITRA